MKIKVLIIAFLLFFVFGCKDKEENESSEAQIEIQNNYDEPFILSLNDESKINMKKNENGFDIEQNDKVIAFIFFTFDCIPCQLEMNYLKEIKEKYSDNLKIVGVLLEDKTKTEIDEFANTLGIDFQIAYGESNYYFANAIGDIGAFPYLSIYKNDGKLYQSYTGLIAPEMLEFDIKRALL